MEKDRVLFIGGSVYDITAKIKGDTVPADSNPSRIYGGCGGVGRNIAVNAAKMGVKGAFLTALGTDSFARLLEESCLEAGLDTSRVLREPGGSSIYLSILERSGELAMAASDLSLLETIPADRLDAGYIASFPTVCVDANPSPEQLLLIADSVRGDLYGDAVSVTKAARFLPILSRFHTLKLNRTELSALSGSRTDTLAELRRAAELLLERGVRRVFVTMGTEGCACLEGDSFLTLPAFPTQVKNVTGAGDAFSAAVIAGAVRGMDNRSILCLGTAASRIALRSDVAVSEELTPVLLERELETVLRLSENAKT